MASVRAYIVDRCSVDNSHGEEQWQVTLKIWAPPVSSISHPRAKNIFVWAIVTSGSVGETAVVSCPPHAHLPVRGWGLGTRLMMPIPVTLQSSTVMWSYQIHNNYSIAHSLHDLIPGIKLKFICATLHPSSNVFKYSVCRIMMLTQPAYIINTITFCIPKMMILMIFVHEYPPQFQIGTMHDATQWWQQWV